MNHREPDELLNNETFLNYCLHKNEEDVRYWQNWIAAHPEERSKINELKAVVVALGLSAAQKQAHTQYAQLQQRINQPAIHPLKPKSFTLWYRIAACLLVFAAAGIYFYNRQHQAVSNYTANKRHDIAPGTNRAMLILADGKKLDLTGAKTGMLLNEGGMRVSKTAKGQLVYQADNSGSGKGFNTIQTPAKGQYMVVLPDGTKVWLNAKTTLTYPVAFTGNDRRVELAGEAYFEVAHLSNPHTSKRVPFVVKTASPNAAKNQEVEVLGTHFNINCYADEPNTITTLLEGSVKVNRLAQNRALLLQPGQQAINGDAQFAVAPANTEAAMAWKNGDFFFREDVNSALRKIARWYDVEIVYLPGAPKHLMLGGWISRQNNISEVLNMLEATGKIHLKLEERRVLVSE